jgi:hypothetical protein
MSKNAGMKAVASMLALSMLIPACAQPSVREPAPSPAARRATAEVAEQVRRCYRSPRVPSVGRRIVTRLLVRYAPNGTLIGLPVLVSQQGITPETQAYAGRMIEAATLAIIRCSPVRLPPELGKRRGNDFYLTFSPGMRA